MLRERIGRPTGGLFALPVLLDARRCTIGLLESVRSRAQPLRGPSVRLKSILQQLSVAAPRMTVRRHVAWPVRLAPYLAAGLLGVAATLLYVRASGSDLPSNAADGWEASRLASQQLAAEVRERERLTALANAADARLLIEQTAVEQLTRQLKSLEGENARLKSDLVYLESLLPSSDSEGLVAVRRFEVTRPAASDRLEYRALLMQGGRTAREFTGSVQFHVELMVDGKPRMLVLPGGGDSGRMRLTFQRVRRLEGQLDVPAGAVVRSVQLRVFEGNAVRAQQTAVL